MSEKNHFFRKIVEFFICDVLDHLPLFGRAESDCQIKEQETQSAHSQDGEEKYDIGFLVSKLSGS